MRFYNPMQYVVGLDLGRQKDYSAIVIDRKIVNSLDDSIHHEICFAHRLPLGVPYPAQAEAVADMMGQLPEMPEPPMLVVDSTGVGIPLVDMLVDYGLRPIAVTLTAGSQWSIDGRSVRLPKLTLASTLNVCLETGRLRIAADLPLLPVMRRELEGFKISTSAAGHDTFGNDSQAAHDDLVVGLGLATFAAEVGLTSRSPRTVLL